MANDAALMREDVIREFEEGEAAWEQQELRNIRWQMLNEYRVPEEDVIARFNATREQRRQETIAHMLNRRRAIYEHRPVELRPGIRDHLLAGAVRVFNALFALAFTGLQVFMLVYFVAFIFFMIERSQGGHPGEFVPCIMHAVTGLNLTL